MSHINVICTIYRGFRAVSTRLWPSQLFFFFFIHGCYGWKKMTHQFSNFLFFWKNHSSEMVFLNQLMDKLFKKKNLEKREKKFFEIFFGKYWKKFALKECGHFNEVGRKILLILFVLLVLPEINLWTRWNYFRFFFFIKEFMM